MKWADIVRRSLRGLRTAKLRTALTALAIAVGSFTLTLTLTAGNGVRDYTSKLVRTNFDPAELLVGRDKEVTNTGSPSDKPQEFDESVTNFQQAGGPNSSLQFKRVSESDIEELRAKPYIEQVRENYQINIRYVSRPGQKKYTGSAQAYNPAQKPDIKTGTLADRGDIAKSTILLPESYVELLGFASAEEAIGKEVQLSVGQPFSTEGLQALISSLQSGAAVDQLASQAKSGEKTVTFLISAVTKKAATSLSFGVSPVLISSDDARELYDFTTLGTNDHGKFLYVNARIKGGEDQQKIDTAKKDLETNGYYAMSSKELQKAITQFVNILQIMVGVFGLITVIASVFGIVNTQYISVLERRSEIGLMKALGLPRKGVNRLFMLEATWIGFLGGTMGIIGAFALGKLVNPFITKKLDLGAGNSLLIFNFPQLLLLLIALMLVATIAGLLPARKAAKLDPIKALRTE